MKIYTKTGDTGSTSLFGGMRVPKHHYRIEAYGTLDELNSWIGLISSLLQEQGIQHILDHVQHELFVLGSWLAAQPDKDNLKLPEVSPLLVEELEQEIDKLDQELAPLQFFIIPGGSAIVSQIHIVRCVCRRAERHCTLVNEQELINPHIITFLNRLSDYLFTLARYAAKQTGTPEIPWKTR